MLHMAVFLCRGDFAAFPQRGPGHSPFSAQSKLGRITEKPAQPQGGIRRNKSFSKDNFIDPACR